MALARALFSDGDIEDAASIVDEIATKHPDNREAQLLTALLTIKKGDLKTAEAKLSNYIKRYPLDGEALVNLAEIAAKQNRSDDAVSWYKAARQSERWKRYAMESELDLYLQTGDLDGALTVINELKLLFPSPQWDELEKQIR